MEREAIEHAIDRALLEQWDPLGVREQPARHAEYHKYVEDIYRLLARGGSDVQVARHLHRLEHEDMGATENPDRDVSAVVKALRAIEHEI